MSKEEKDISFESLVKAINEKWGHTYEDPQEDEIVIPDYDLS